MPGGPLTGGRRLLPSWWSWRGRRGCRCAVFLDVPLTLCQERNDRRTGRARVPPVGSYAAAARLAPPGPEEGLDRVDVLR